jgi:hypothetical protein
MPDQQATPTPELASSEDARARANPEQTHVKANHPWFTKWRVILSLAVISLMMIIWGANNKGDTGTTHAAKGDSKVAVTNTVQAKAASAGIGTKVRDGKLEFVVTDVQHPGKTLAGKVGEILTAHGAFVIVVVNVSNVGQQDQTPSCSCQILMNDKGQRFQPSSAILRTKEALKFVRLIKPGETVNGVLLLFDVAPGTNIVKIELHDSPLSPGVDVRLT